MSKYVGLTLADLSSTLERNLYFGKNCQEREEDNWLEDLCSIIDTPEARPKLPMLHFVLWDYEVGQSHTCAYLEDLQRSRKKEKLK